MKTLYNNIKELIDLPIEGIKNYSRDEQIFILEKLVKYHNQRYFLDNDTVISDEDFDKLTILLKKLNPLSSALYEIVGDIGDVTHPYPLLSIDKVFSFEEVVKWLNDVNDSLYLVEPKYDGMRAIYRKDTKILATRGNGRVGENISERFKYLNIIGDIDKAGNFVEGEIVIPQDYFDTNLSKVYKNSRNAVVGIIKSKTITAEGIKALNDGGVHFVIYDQVYAQKVNTKTLLNKERFEEILENTFHSIYPLDGVVIKATSEKIKQNLGATAHHQRWQIAYKIPGMRKWTKIVGITNQVGRTGRITAVAHIKPINLSGATIKNVTLHNFDYIKKEKIGIGADVEVIRSGEVIPFITNVKPATKVYLAPKLCPECGAKTKFSGKYLECTNPRCSAKIWQEVEYFFKTLGVEELGEKTVKRFIKEFNFTNILDFYNLTTDQIQTLEGFKQKSADKIVFNIKNTLNKTITPVQLLNALGIREVGRSTAILILNEYGFNKLTKITVEDLLKIKGIGPQIANSFVTQIKQKWPIINALIDKGLTFKQTKTSLKLSGLSFCVTGKKQKYSREELIKIIIENGGEYKSSVTKDLNYLIAGEEAGSKLQKAIELEVKVINEDEFLKMV